MLKLVHIDWRCVCALLAVALAAAPWGNAAPPLDPLPAPYYSFDAASPAVQAGIVLPADILLPGPTQPIIVVAGAQIGLPDVADELDALSGSNAMLPAGQPFLLTFSVDRQSVAGTPPEPLLVELFVPYNVTDQAARGHAAGDQFLSTAQFNRQGRLPFRGGGPSNNTLSRNNYDEGGTDFTAAPSTSARDETPGVPQDNTNATGAPSPRSGFLQVYFSAGAESPSLPFLPNGMAPSGANLFFAEAMTGRSSPSRYADFAQLGLVQGDDIDAVLVFDLNEDAVFNGNDRVLFSLTRSSPSLAFLPGSAADVFGVAPGAQPVVFAAAGELGLDPATDDLDALALFPCADPLLCLERRGIRGLPGDWNDDGQVDLTDFAEYPTCMNGPDIPLAAPDCRWLDIENDTDVDLRDFVRFQEVFTGSLR